MAEMQMGHVRRNHVLVRILMLGAGALVAATLTPRSSAADQETVLYSFCAKSGCTDGEGPYAGLVMDAAGNLYGTTASGGAQGDGTAFELTPNTARTKWRETVLYSFCAQSDCTDGSDPYAGLIMDAAGNLYGTTYGGGLYGYGTVFALTPPAKGKIPWTHKMLYSFCAQGGTACTDGGQPVAGLIMNGAGKLYGTTDGGGLYGYGTVFELTRRTTGKTAWTEKVLYSFCPKSDCPDGAGPLAGLIMDAAGNLYGTTQYGGVPEDLGTAFELTPPAKGETVWRHRVLYSFCEQGGTACTDGEMPTAGNLVLDAAGNLYGMTYAGGAHDVGTVFELTPPAKGEALWRHKVLHSFCARSSCIDGHTPFAGLIIDAAGNLYGTTDLGGARGGGTAFELTPPAKGKTAWTEQVLYSFCERSGCTDGVEPTAGLIMDAAGELYGTSFYGGAHGIDYGTVFELTP
jgi:uncharacterized repeat protein (TIGR03803 family)